MADGIQVRLRAGVAELLAAADVVLWDASGAAYPASPDLPPCYDTSYPDTGPDVCVALSTYYTGGDGKADITTWLQLQVRTRGQKHGPSTDADNLDDAIAQQLMGFWRRALPNGVIISFIEHISSTPIGRDAAGRFERTTNWSVRVADSATYRI